MLVTSFILQRDGKSTHSVEKYFSQFKRMRDNVDSKIILFLDKQFSPDLFESEKNNYQGNHDETQFTNF